MTLRNITVEPGDTAISVLRSRGFHHQKIENTFSVELFIDLINNRLKIINYTCNNYNDLVNYLEYIASENHLTKIIMVAQEADWQKLFVRGFEMEALHPTILNGSPGFHVSKFLTNERRVSTQWEKEEAVIKLVRGARPKTKKLGDGFRIRTATTSDISALTRLFTTVFSTYPTPLNDADYLRQILQGDAVFKVVVHNEQVVSAASIDIDYATGSAELTDCATLPAFEGQGLMSHLVVALEEDAVMRRIVTLYTIARAVSVGINMVFARHGYRYYGRFVNNCDICGNFEDMNLWSKKIQQT